MIVGFPGGSASDTTARLIGQWLSERLGQPFVIENRPGAASNLAAEAVVRAPPDGYTLLLVISVNAINANLGFDLIRDIVPVARLVQGPGVMEVNPAFPAKTVPELECALDGGQFQAAVLTGCWACRSSYCAGLR
jgi:tripartite-type tricarboxylate transporter receptor subunit TctC